MKMFGAAAMAMAIVLTAPAGAQSFSDSYTFLKAVRDRDGVKAQTMASTPGVGVLNAKDRGTGDTGLHIVARERDSNWLGFLLSKGARPDVQNNAGETPLTLATQLGWTEGAQLLLGRRAMVDYTNGRGETPLIIAVQLRDVGMVRLLLTAGANPRKTDRASGYSAIDHAKRDGRGAAVLKMLESQKAPSRASGPSL